MFKTEQEQSIPLLSELAFENCSFWFQSPRGSACHRARFRSLVQPPGTHCPDCCSAPSQEPLSDYGNEHPSPETPCIPTDGTCKAVVWDWCIAGNKVPKALLQAKALETWSRSLKRKENAYIHEVKE